MNRCLLILILLSSIKGLYAQPPAYSLIENSNWKFYQYGGIRFTNNSPVADTSAMRFQYGVTSPNPGVIQTYNAAAVSDTAGQLLFYTDAYKVWDRNHNEMPNGNGLLTSNALDAALITPVPDHPGRYYIFYMAGEITLLESSPNAFSLYYTVVDMTLNNGMGDIVAGQKNVLVSANLSGAIKAVPGDDCNLWLITHDLYNTQFKVFEVSNAGVSTSPVLSNAGNGVVGFLGPLSFGGNIAVSHNRTRLVFAQNGGDLVPIVELFDFNPGTGAVSNGMVIDTLGFFQSYGLCFSPNNSKLYLSLLNPGELSPANPNNLHVESSLYQYDLSQATAGAIDSSRVLLSDSISSYNNVLRMGPDGKIYFPASYGGDTSSGLSYLYPYPATPATYTGPAFQAYIGRIENPDQAGLACNINRHALALNAYSSQAETMGGVFVKPLPPDTSFITHDTVVCNLPGNTLNLQAPSADFSTFHWDNGSTNAQRSVSVTGTYWVRSGDYCHFRLDTFHVFIDSIAVTIVENANVLSTTTAYDSYQWLYNGNLIPGATNSTLAISADGSYAVIVGLNNCKDTSAVYQVGETGIDGPDQIANRIKVYPVPAGSTVFIKSPVKVDIAVCSVEGKTIRKVEDARSVFIGDLSDGLYFLRITNSKGGLLLKTVKITKQE